MAMKNIGKNDKIIRSVIALVLAYYAWTWSAWLWILVAIVIYTITTSFCWPYKLLGINTNKKSK